MLVALSAAYGARGSLIGRQVSELLEVPLYDHAITVRIAAELGVGVSAIRAVEVGHEQHLISRIASAFSLCSADVPVVPGIMLQDLRAATFTAIQAYASTGDAVIMSYGACSVLREHPGALRVRLTGQPRARALQATLFGELPLEETERARRRNDRRESVCVKKLYGQDVEDPGLYHMVLDSTSMSTSACAKLIVEAAMSTNLRLARGLHDRTET